MRQDRRFFISRVVLVLGELDKRDDAQLRRVGDLQRQPDTDYRRLDSCESRGDSALVHGTPVRYVASEHSSKHFCTGGSMIDNFFR